MEALKQKKTNPLLILISHQRDIDNKFLQAKYKFERKYPLLIKKRESLGLKHYIDLKAFIEYLNHMDDIYRNVD